MKALNLGVILVVGLTAAACAKRPENISAVSMDVRPYVQMSCQNLTEEKIKIVSELNSLSAAQNSAATSDAIGVFLLGIPLASVSGNDKEALIAVAKGRVDAINIAQVRKNCI